MFFCPYYRITPSLFQEFLEQKRIFKTGLTLARFEVYVPMIVEETREYFKRWGDSGEQSKCVCVFGHCVCACHRVLKCSSCTILSETSIHMCAFIKFTNFADWCVPHGNSSLPKKLFNFLHKTVFIMFEGYAACHQDLFRRIMARIAAFYGIQAAVLSPPQQPKFAPWLFSKPEREYTSTSTTMKRWRRGP